MRRALVAAALAAAAATALAPASATAVRMPGILPMSVLGGGVVDLASGRDAERAPEPRNSAGAVTVLSLRPGARYRVPVVITTAPGARVDLTHVRLVTGATTAARQAGTVYDLQCCAIANPWPLDEVRLAPRGAVESVSIVVGVDVELCCAPPAAGWTERLVGVDVTYRRDGVTRTVFQPFGDAQTVVARG